MRLLELSSDLVPSPVEYAVLLPARTQDAADLQLILDLHGGGGNRDRLKQEQPLFDSLWKSGRLPPGAVAALEPGIEPILRWEDMRPKHRFLRSDDLFERAFGKPADAQYWAANIRPRSCIVIPRAFANPVCR